MRWVMQVVAVLALAAAALPLSGQVREEPDVVMFSREGCPHCAAARSYLAELQRRRPGLRVVVHEVSRDTAALRRLRELAAAQQAPVLGVPAFVVGGRLIVGFESTETTGRRIEGLLARPPPGADACTLEPEEPCPEQAAASRGVVDLPLVGRVSAERMGLPLFTVLLGLVDGFNPCAMWVLVFLLSILVNLRSRARMLLIGGIFVAVSGAVYFAFMAAWLNLFLVIGISRTAQVVLGVAAGAAGLLNVKDFAAMGRGVSLHIPEQARPGIYTRARRILRAENLGGAVGGVVVLAVLVNLVELLCTAGLPALYTQFLAMRQLSAGAYYGYLALYNLAYMLDDSVLLLASVWTLSHRRLQEGQGRWLKLVSGSVMLLLAGLLLLRPEWLSP